MAFFKLVSTAHNANDIRNLTAIEKHEGQLIISDSGIMFYDTSTDRIELSPDTSHLLEKSFANSLVTGVNFENDSENNAVKIKIDTINPADNTTESKEFNLQLENGTIVENDGNIVFTLTDFSEDLKAKIKEEIEALAANPIVIKTIEIEDETKDEVAIANTWGETTPNNGDMAICIRTINGDKKSRTAYIYDGESSNWVALDGNYNANNVYFSEDLLTTTAIGNITLTNGQATISAKGGNLIDLFNTIYVKEDNVSLKKSSPSAKLSSTSTTYYEIGTTGTRNITVSMNDDGEYKYGYLPLASETGNEAAGSVATSITTGTGTGVAVTATKPFELTFNGVAVEPTVENGATFTLAPTAQTNMTEMKIKGKMNYDKGGIPVSNLKKLYPAQRIAAGSDETDEVSAFRWYIPFYQGFTYADTAIADHANITATELTTKLAAPVKQTSDGKVVSSSQNVKNIDAVAYSKTKCTKAVAAKAWRQYYLAYPKDWSFDMSGAKDSNGIDCTVNQAKDVELDINGTKVTYAVYYIHNAADYGTLGITWTLG